MALSHHPSSTHRHPPLSVMVGQYTSPQPQQVLLCCLLCRNPLLLVSNTHERSPHTQAHSHPHPHCWLPPCNQSLSCFCHCCIAPKPLTPAQAHTLCCKHNYQHTLPLLPLLHTETPRHSLTRNLLACSCCSTAASCCSITALSAARACRYRSNQGTFGLPYLSMYVCMHGRPRKCIHVHIHAPCWSSVLYSSCCHCC